MESWDGKVVAAHYYEKMQKRVQTLHEHSIFPHLVVVSVEPNDETLVYIALKERACEKVKIQFTHVQLTNEEWAYLESFEPILEQTKGTALLVQHPVPNHPTFASLFSCVDERYEVDGLHPNRYGQLLTTCDDILPSAARAVLAVLHYYNVIVDNHIVAVIGHDDLLCKPLVSMLYHTKAHIIALQHYDESYQSLIKEADIIISATYHQISLKEADVKDGVIIMDAGIHHEQHHACGDLEKVQFIHKAKAWLGVPGGLGPVTIAMLIDNVIRCTEQQR